MNHVARKLPGVIDGEGSVVDARDVASAVVVALLKAERDERYVVAGCSLTLGEILETLARVTGVPAPTRKVPTPVAWAMAALSSLRGRLTRRPVPLSLAGLRTVRARLAASSAKACRELGVTFRPFDETVRDAVSWYVRDGYVSPVPPVLREVAHLGDEAR